MKRRRFLELAGAAGIALPLGTALDANAASTGPLKFAVVTDTHSNVDRPDRLAWLGRTFRSIEKREPSFVLNCGDITEYGGDNEYEAYLATIPDGLKPRTRHVPGNHELRWDVHGQELYHRLFGPSPFSFTIDGLHVVGLDPTQLLQEPGYFGRDHLRWLEADLARAGSTPTIGFLHYPMAGDFYYVNDQLDFLSSIADSPMRAIFAGHIHGQQVQRFNQLTQVSCDDAGGAPVYYWVERIDNALQVSSVRLAADDTETSEAVTSIPLSIGDDRWLRPTSIEVSPPADGKVAVRVRVDGRAKVDKLQAQVYPQHIYGDDSESNFADLVPRGGATWQGLFDVAAIPAGFQQIHVRAKDASGSSYEGRRIFRLPGNAGGPVVRWQTRLDGKVQGALASRDGVVVAATSKGQVRAFRPSTSGDRPQWTARIGPAYRGAAFGQDGSTVFVPSADHHLYALSTRNGQQRWRFCTPEPILSTPVVAGSDTVVFTAGKRIYAVNAWNGKLRWSSDLHGFFAGRVAFDGERIYTGGGDGNAYAFDAVTGKELWTFSTTTRTTDYVRLIYGPWDDVVELLPSGLVLVSTVAGAFALDRATGVQKWTVAGSYVYSPSILLDDSRLLLTDEWGKAQVVDPTTGTRAWGPFQVGTRMFNAGPVISKGKAWQVTTTGLLIGYDLATGTVEHRLQLGPIWTFSTPVLVHDNLLVTADQAGVLRAVQLP